MVGWAFCFLFMGKVVKSSVHGWMLRGPPAVCFATFLGVQAAAWERPGTVWNDIMTQPAPHGTYVRKSVKEHFPVWWNNISADLHTSGHSLPEMNEYDKSTMIQNDHTKFDKTIM